MVPLSTVYVEWERSYPSRKPGAAVNGSWKFGGQKQPKSATHWETSPAAKNWEILTCSNIPRKSALEKFYYMIESVRFYSAYLINL